MPDNLKRKGPEDPKTININQTWELNYWSKKFNVSITELENAVTKVGTSVSSVQIYLQIRN